jgi:hypothetical protein
VGVRYNEIRDKPCGDAAAKLKWRHCLDMFITDDLEALAGFGRIGVQNFPLPLPLIYLYWHGLAPQSFQQFKND